MSEPTIQVLQGDGAPKLLEIRPNSRPISRPRVPASDPPGEQAEPDSLVEHRAVLRPGTRRQAPALPKAKPRLDRLQSDAAGDRAPGVTSGRRSRPSSVCLSDLEIHKPQGIFDRLLGEDARRRLFALGELVERESTHDRFGFSPLALRRSLPFFHALYRAYFRVQSQGHEHLPAKGPAVLAGNHAGLLPFDAAMTVLDVMLQTDPPRLPRAMVDRWAGTLPWLNVFYARVGQVIGTRENFSDLLDDGQLVLVFPEGIEGMRKRIHQRYRLQHFRIGFVEQALRARAPIVPVAIVGSDDQTPILVDIKPLARWLGLPVVPITPTFPWLGPLGLLPYPVGYRIVYGEPLCFHEHFGPEAADDAPLVRQLASKVQSAVQRLLDRNR